MASDNEQNDDNAKADSYARLNTARAFNSQSEPSFSEEFAAARRKYKAGKGGSTFTFNGKSYTVETREEAARGKANEMARESRRSRAPEPRAEIPRGGDYKAPASTGGGMSETSRNVRNAMNALSPGVGAAASTATRAAGLAVKGAKAGVDAARSASAARQTAQVVRDPRTREPMNLPAPSKEIARDSDRVNFKNGGKVGCYANGGLVKRAVAKSHGKAC